MYLSSLVLVLVLVLLAMLLWLRSQKDSNVPVKYRTPPRCVCVDLYRRLCILRIDVRGVFSELPARRVSARVPKLLYPPT